MKKSLSLKKDQIIAAISSYCGFSADTDTEDSDKPMTMEILADEFDFTNKDGSYIGEILKQVWEVNLGEDKSDSNVDILTVFAFKKHI